MKSPRKLAFESFVLWKKTGKILEEDYWEKQPLSKKDLALAKEIFYGSVRLFFRLEYILKKLSKFPKSPPLAVKILLIQALYQHYYLKKIPIYAIVNETVKLAKSLGEMHAIGYINALLRNLPKTVDLPENLDWETFFSFPQYFIDLLIEDYGKDQTQTILALFNEHPKEIMARERMNHKFLGFEKMIHEKFFRVGSIKKEIGLETLSQDASIYIQNVTQVVLMEELIRKSFSGSFQKILDLCAAPGGKTILLSENFPNAHFFANDINPDKAKILIENFQKYSILEKIKLSHFSAENFPLDETFDLVVCDVPCSNSGVLHKRAEARYRILPENLKELRKLQLSILKRAYELIKDDGQIWYLTCSILQQENEKFLQEVCQILPLKVTYSKTILPNEKGWDGGYAAIVKRK